MTTGNRILDNRVSVAGTCGTGLVGMFSQKTWNGTDSTDPSLVRGSRRWLLVNSQHPYTMTYDSLFNSTLQYATLADPTWKSGDQASCFGGVQYLAVPADSSNEDLKALLKLRNKIEGGEFDLSVFLGTSHQSLRLIAENANLLYRGFRALRRGDVKTAKRVFTSKEPVWHPHIDDAPVQFVRHSIPKEIRAIRRESLSSKIANLHLQLQYGWLPLLSDIDEAANKLAFQLYHNLPVQRVRAGRVRKVTGTFDTGAVTAPQHTSYGVNYTLYKYLVGPANNVQLTGVLNPENLVWELLPGSFVFDWIIPIGNYLEARAAVQRMGGILVKSVKTEQYVGPLQSGAITKIRNNASFNRKVTLNRTISNSANSNGSSLEGVPLPSLVSFSSVPSWRRAANSIALLTQALSKTT